MMDNAGDQFQEQTKDRSEHSSDQKPRGHERPPLYKTYPAGAKVALPSYEPGRSMSLDQALRARKSIREYRAEPLGLGQLSYLLWACAGLQRTEGGYEFRTAPSAGALYPIETYIVANAVGRLEPGLYHYGIGNHQLEKIRTGTLRRQITAAALDQRVCASAPALFIWTALFARATWKYGLRAYRYIYLEAGHMAENLALAAVSLGLGTCQIGAIRDDDVNQLLDVDRSEESVIYMSVVGVPPSADGL